MTDYSHYQHLLFARQDHGILRMTINRPEVYNATNARLHWELSRVWLDIGDDPDTRVVVVTVQLNGTRAWESSVNGELWAAAGRWANVRIADWYGASSGHPGYFSGDSIHLSSSGAQAYAGVVAAAL